MRKVSEAASVAGACGRLVNMQYSLVFPECLSLSKSREVSLEALLPCAEMGLQKLQFLLLSPPPPLAFPAPTFFPGLMNF